MSNRFQTALSGKPQSVPPIWFMRQAGRYQRAYQDFRRKHTFEEMCRDATLSAGVAVAAVEDFDFDAAILFSDLLFPLDAIGLKLSYTDEGPRLARRFDDRTPAVSARSALKDLAFQAEAVAETRKRLPSDRGLIGFMGGPWTLFVYAVEGTHTGSLTTAKTSLPLYRKFARIIVPMLEGMARAQLEAGADVVMVFDTAIGELAPETFRHEVAADLSRLASAVPNRLGYYGRGLHPAHLGAPAAITDAPWAGLGVDWRWRLSDLLTSTRTGFVQGNFDPALLHLTGAALKRAIEGFLSPIAALPEQARGGWICGLGHGVLPRTPEASVRAFVRTVRRRLT